MSEEATMDKNKNVRNVVPSKGAIEKSRQSDSSRFSKNGRNKNSYHVRQDFSSNKKPPAPVKNKGFDKRPRQKSFHGAYTETNQQVELQTDAEVGSAQNYGSKKTNLNHLLNFKYELRNDAGAGSFHGNKNWRQPRRRAFNKEQFIQANCKFSVKDSGDYTVHMADPDVLVDWSQIEEVCVMTMETANCPICLYPPQAAKLTRCGHIYCWPCVLHYLALSNKEWRKCPICDELIKKEDLKSVTTQCVRSFNVGDVINMQLMVKQRGSVQVKPAYFESAEKNKDQAFSKLTRLSTHEVDETILNREHHELSILYALDEDSPELCFIQEAMQLLEKRKKENNIIAAQPSLDVASNPTTMPQDFALFQQSEVNASASNVVYANAFDDVVLSEGMEQINIQQSPINNEPVLVTDNHSEACRITQKPKELYYFYQASDGQPIYLHGLNVKMLVKEYGSLEQCPQTITAKIVQVEANTMDEVLRKRLRYLNHLPLHCEFLVVELQFNECHMSKDNIAAFQSEVKRRKQQRQKKARDERKREKIIESKENEKMGLYPGMNVNVDSLSHFPACNESDALEAEQFAFGLRQEEQEQVDDQAMACSPSNSASFAQMLLAGKKKPNIAFKADVATEQSVLDEDGQFAPDYHQSFSNAIQTALDSIPTENNGNEASGKKKKFKKKLLFSTSMNRSK